MKLMVPPQIKASMVPHEYNLQNLKLYMNTGNQKADLSTSSIEMFFVLNVTPLFNDNLVCIDSWFSFSINLL